MANVKPVTAVVLSDNVWTKHGKLVTEGKKLPQKNGAPALARHALRATKFFRGDLIELPKGEAAELAEAGSIQVMSNES